MKEKHETHSKHTQHVAIPRSHKAALKLGYKPASITHADLTDELHAHVVRLSDTGARAGSLCSIAPSTQPGYWLVGYKDANGDCTIFIHVPKGAPIPRHR